MDFKLFAERVKEARKRAGLSQAELAEKLGVGQNTVSNYENTTGSKGSAPKLETAAKMAEVLDVSLDWLVGGELSSTGNETLANRAFLRTLIDLAQNDSITVIDNSAFGDAEHAFYGIGFWIYGDMAKSFGEDLKNFLTAENLLKSAGLSDDMNKAAVQGLKQKLLDKYVGLFQIAQFEKAQENVEPWLP